MNQPTKTITDVSRLPIAVNSLSGSSLTDTEKMRCVEIGCLQRIADSLEALQKLNESFAEAQHETFLGTKR